MLFYPDFFCFNHLPRAKIGDGLYCYLAGYLAIRPCKMSLFSFFLSFFLPMQHSLKRRDRSSNDHLKVKEASTQSIQQRRQTSAAVYVVVVRGTGNKNTIQCVSLNLPRFHLDILRLISQSCSRLILEFNAIRSRLNLEYRTKKPWFQPPQKYRSYRGRVFKACVAFFDQGT